MSLDWSDGGPNPYDILGLANGPEATADEIKKVYRKLAIVKHPDKNRKNPNAAAEFGEIDKAYRVLLDAAARGALDDWIKAKVARQAREDQTSDKRRKLRQDLELREKRAAGERNEEEVAKMRLRAELDRLRKRAEEEERKSRQQAAEAAARSAPPPASAQPSDATAEGYQVQLRRSLKVSWDPTAKDYTSEQLRSIFAVHGRVEDVVLKDRKKKRKANAFVVMSTEAQAQAAVACVCGDAEEPLLVTPLLKCTPGLAQGDDSDHGPAERCQSGAAASSSAGSGRAATLPVAPLPRAAGLPPANPGRPLFPSGQPAAGQATKAGPSPLFPTGSFQAPTPPGHSGAKSFPAGGFGSFPGFGGGPAAAGAGGFEAAVLDKMRREAERRRALEEAEAE